MFDSLAPIVTVKQNFDELLIPPDHVSRQPSDTYYVDGKRVLRCHTSAHQTALLRQGEDPFLVCGDVYRRDEVDSTHYPVFHQMEGVRILPEEEVRNQVLRNEKDYVMRIDESLDYYDRRTAVTPLCSYGAR